MDETQCMIETDGGLFDCGMDTQMRNLIKDIKIPLVNGDIRWKLIVTNM